MSTLELYHRCCANDEAAYHELGCYLLRSARFQLKGDPDLISEAEDCVQNALYNIFCALQSGRGPRQPEHFKKWATTILTRRVIDRQRERGRRPTQSLDGPIQSGDDEHEEIRGERIADTKSPNPAEIMAYQETLVEVIQRICHHPDLTENERIILRDGYLNGISSQALEQRLGITLSTVNVTRKRAREKLQKDKPLMAQISELLRETDNWSQSYAWLETFFSADTTDE